MTKLGQGVRHSGGMVQRMDEGHQQETQLFAAKAESAMREKEAKDFSKSEAELLAVSLSEHSSSQEECHDADSLRISSQTHSSLVANYALVISVLT